MKLQNQFVLVNSSTIRSLLLVLLFGLLFSAEIRGAAPPILKNPYILRIKHRGMIAIIDVRASHLPGCGIIVGSFVRPHPYVAVTAALLPNSSPFQTLAGVVSLDCSENQITDEELDWIASCPFLEELTFGGPKITDDSLRRLRRRLPRLRVLNLGKTTRITDTGLIHLQICSSLESLSVPWWITDNGIAYLVGLKKLRTLNLGGCELSDNGCASLSKLINLRHLKLAQTKVGDRGVSYLVTLRHLKSLDLNLTKVTDKGLTAVGRLTDLEDLDLFGVDISDLGVASLAQLTRLKNLDLTSAKISDKGLASLRGLRQLRYLRLGNSARITDVGVRILSNFLDLEQLDLSDSKIGDMGVRTIAKLPRLRELDLSNTMIGDKGLMLLNECERLRILDVSQTGVTRVGINKLRRELPRLEINASHLDD